LKYQIGISLIKGIGPVLARNMIAYLGSEEAVFREGISTLSKVPGIGKNLAYEIKQAKVLDRAEKEVAFIEKHQIEPVFFTHPDYPQKLSFCDDAPLMLFKKGRANLGASKIVSVVGTRRASDAGKVICEKLVHGLAERYPEIVIVSGMAYGIDICAHRAALKQGVSTVGVMAHGLDRMYPGAHQQTARQMIENKGAIITEFMSETNPDKHNFVQRNRIVAGLCDAVIVIESGIKGGALITARMASSYNRDVLAVPGAPDDELRQGCNFLIKKNVAALIETVEDVEYALGWESELKKTGNTQRKLFTEFNSEEEKQVYKTLYEAKELTASALSLQCALPVSQVNALLLNLEFAGLVKALPGNAFRVV
jgi:DNA processing protein